MSRPSLISPTVAAEHIAQLWTLAVRADNASATSTAPNASPGEREHASTIRCEAQRRVELLWSAMSMLEPSDAKDAFVLAIRAHDLARDLADPGFPTKDRTAEAITELRQLTGTLAAFLGRSAGTTAAALGLGDWFMEAKADWPRASALPVASPAPCASPLRHAATAADVGMSAS